MRRDERDTARCDGCRAPLQLRCPKCGSAEEALRCSRGATTRHRASFCASRGGTWAEASRYAIGHSGRRRGRARTRCPFPAPGDTRSGIRLGGNDRVATGGSCGTETRQPESILRRVWSATRQSLREVRRGKCARHRLCRNLRRCAFRASAAERPSFEQRQFAIRLTNSRIPPQPPTASARRSPRCSPTSRARPS